MARLISNIVRARSHSTGVAASVALIAFSAAAGPSGRSQEETTPHEERLDVHHTPPPCMDTETFPLVEVMASSATAARDMARLVLRFRAEEDSGWYETEFRSSSGVTLQAALPKPQIDAVRVVYYFTTGEDGRRSESYFVPVLMGGCPGARSATGDIADEIRVRRSSVDQLPIPVGFSPDGIRAGGSVSGTTLAMVAAGGAGAGIAALVISGEEPPPTDGGNLPNPEAIRACFTPDPIPDIDSGDTILFDASCTTPVTVTSYQWNFGDGSPPAQGSSIEHRFIPGGVYTVRLTASDGTRSDSISRVVQVRATPSACFITNPDPPRIAANEGINFNAECSEGDRDGGPAEIVRYEWDFGDGRPGAEGVFVSRQFPQPDVYGVRLTVTNADGFQDSNTQFVVVENRTTSEPEGLRSNDVTVTSILEFPDAPRAQLVVNDTGSATTSGTQRLRLRARTGENVVEGRLVSRAATPGTWRFDFRATSGFVAGSIRVDSGRALAQDGTSVVFQLSGDPSEQVRFRFRME